MISRLLAVQSSRNNVKFTVDPSKNNNKITIGSFTEPFGGVINWGDGNFSNINSNVNLSHTYESGTTSVDIVITGRCGGFWNSTANGASKKCVIELKNISSTQLVSLANTFSECKNLVTIPEEINAPNLTNCTKAFYNCNRIESKLTKIWEIADNIAHTNCFTKCYYSYYHQKGTANCPNAKYHDAVPAQYDTTYGDANTTAYEFNKTGCSSYRYVECTTTIDIKDSNTDEVVETIGSVYSGTTLEICGSKANWNATRDNVGDDKYDSVTIYPNDTKAYTYKCNHNCPKTSEGMSKEKKVADAQSAYYSCNKIGSTNACIKEDCTWAASNTLQTSIDEAKSKGWL